MRSISVFLLISLLCFSPLVLFSFTGISGAQEALTAVSKEENETEIKIDLEKQKERVEEIVKQHRQEWLNQDLEKEESNPSKKKARKVFPVTNPIPINNEPTYNPHLILFSILIVALGLIFIFLRVYRVKKQ